MLWILLKMARSEDGVSITCGKFCLSLCSDIGVSTMIEECQLKLIGGDPVCLEKKMYPYQYTPTILCRLFLFFTHFHWFVLGKVFSFWAAVQLLRFRECSEETNASLYIEFFWFCSWRVGLKKYFACIIENLICSLTTNVIQKSWEVF